MMTLTTVFKKTLEAYTSNKFTIISNVGGTRSGKTYSTLQLIYFIATGRSQNLLISVVSRSMSHLKRGCLRDWESILDSVDRAGLVDINLTDHIYTLGNNNKVEFFSADDVGKMHGAQRDMIFLNEANFIEESKVKQLFVRTSGTKFIDYNPSADFWLENYKLRSDFIEIHSTYKDNEFLTEEQVKEIESNKRNHRWWSIYGEGKSYFKEGLIYPNVKFEQYHKFTHPTYGMDFGFVDPTTLVRVEIEGEHLYVQLCFYQKGLSVQEIKAQLDKFVRKGKDLVICDNAEPNIIRELHNAGFRVKPCKKGKNSIFDGIQLCNGFQIVCVTGDLKYDEEGKEQHLSEKAITNALIKEFKAYSWETDLDGNYIDIPEDKNNHAMDALRYVVQYLRAEKKTGTYTYSFV